MFKKILLSRKENIAFLRQVAQKVGSEIEKWPYEKLSQPSELISFSRTIDGALVYFSIEAYNEKKNGDIHICIDVNADIATFPFLKLPSYVFWKCQDGNVYYE